MDELAKVIIAGLREPLALESGSIPTPSQLRSAATAVRSFLLSEERVEAAATAHCDFFGGEGWWETGLLADTLPKGREAARAAINCPTWNKAPDTGEGE